MNMSMDYDCVDDEIDIHNEMKPYDMLGSHDSDFGEDQEDYRDMSSPGISNSSLHPSTLIGHEDQSSIGLRRRAAHLKQEDEMRIQRISSRGSGMYHYSSTRPKRILQNWERVHSYPNTTAAEEGLKTHQSCRWMKGNKSNTKEGRKEYYACREGTACPAMIHLLYEAKSTRVHLFQNDLDHVHIGERKRGLPVQVEQFIRELFASGTKKPSQIQQCVVKQGMKEIQKSQLANFLQKLKRETGDTEYETDSYAEGTAGRNCYRSSWSETPESGQGTQQGDSQSCEGLGSIAPLEFAAAEYNQPPQDISLSAEPSANALLNFSGLTPSHTLQHEKTSLNNIQPTTTGNQSEIVSSSCGKRFYCRDESTEEGEQCLPNEENIKDMIIQHLKTNYSNRDMLHIREELRTLRKEKKYPVLNRLVSFTAGFLQDTFMEDHTVN